MDARKEVIERRVELSLVASRLCPARPEASDARSFGNSRYPSLVRDYYLPIGFPPS